MVDNRALVLVEEAIRPDDLDKSDIESRLRDAEQALEQAEKDSEEYRRHERSVKRYTAFLEVQG